jgi:predicted RNA binding protein YcfA (HicA-like mRNA interferase family)
MKCSELLRKLKKNGFKFDRQGKGSHEIWKNEAGIEVVVPNHGSQEIATGTAKKIIKDAGLK